jgi:hypothetical protein
VLRLQGEHDCLTQRNGDDRMLAWQLRHRAITHSWRQEYPGMATRTVSYQQVVDVVLALPPDRLASVYDFARFVQTQSSAVTPMADIFGETE